MNQVVITSISNPSFIPRIVEAYNKLRTVPELVLFVLDRCENNMLSDYLNTSRLNFIIVHTGFNDNVFAAGRPRDFGVQYLEKLGITYKHIVFIDGDCLPSSDLFEEHARIHRSVSMFAKYPVLVNSMRIDIQEDGRQIPDARIKNNCIFSKGKDIVTVFDKHLYVDEKMYPACVGCNISLNAEAIKLARFINSTVLGDGRIFAHVFDGQWGGEDPYLSATLFRAGALCVNANPSKSWVLHCYHGGNHRNNQHVKYLVQALGKFNSLSRSRKLVLPATVFTTSHKEQSGLIGHLSAFVDATYPEITRLATHKMLSLCNTENDRLLALFVASRVYGFQHTTTPTIRQAKISNQEYDEFFRRAVNSCFELRDFNLTEPYDYVYTKNTNTQEQFYHNSHGMFR